MQALDSSVMYGVETILNVAGGVALLLWGVRMGLHRPDARVRPSLASRDRRLRAQPLTAFAGGVAATGLTPLAIALHYAGRRYRPGCCCP
jgi:hypothetical protein